MAKEAKGVVFLVNDWKVRRAVAYVDNELGKENAADHDKLVYDRYVELAGLVRKDPPGWQYNTGTDTLGKFSGDAKFKSPRPVKGEKKKKK